MWRIVPLLAVVAILGLYPLLTKLGLTSGIHPLDVLALRCIPTGAILLPHFFAMVRGMDRRSALLLATAGLAQGLLAGALAIGALQMTSPSHAVLGPAMVGFFSIAIGWLRGGAGRATRTQVAACALSVCGCSVILAVSYGGHAGVDPIGDLLFLGAAAASAVYIQLTAAQRLAPLQVVAVSAVPSAMVYLPFYLATRAGLPVTDVAPLVWVIQLVTQAILIGAVLNICLASSAQRIGAHKTSLGIALVPVVTTGISALMLGEQLPYIQWLAVAFLCGGSLLGVLARNRADA